MIDPGIKQQILDDLDQMSPELQRRVQELVHGLATFGDRPPSQPGKDLHRFAGMWDEQTGREIEAAIEEGSDPGRGRPVSEVVERLRARPPVTLDDRFGEDLLRILAEESPPGISARSRR